MRGPGPSPRVRPGRSKHLAKLAASGVDLPGDPTILASAINALLEQFCRIWIIEGGEPIGRELDADEAIDTVTDFILNGIAGRRTPAAAPTSG